MSDQILLNPGEEFEKFTVEQELGHGGMGAVYLVRHKVLGAEFALKVLYPEVARRDRQFVERFIREARLAGGIRHQNLIAVYDAGLNEQSGMYYLVMDYVSGGSVREILKRDGYVDMVEAISIVRQVASALEAAQQRNMVHRDIKPDNIMFDSHGVVRLADLGIAKATDDCGSNLTVEASVFGTPSYMSPEQARDASKVDTRADIYSLGVVLFEMLTGRRPFGGETSIEILAQVIGSEEAPDVRNYSPDVPELVAKLVADMLAKNISKRIASPTELIKRIDCIDLSAYCGYAADDASTNEDDRSDTDSEDLDVTLQTLPDIAQKAAAKAASESEEDLDVTLQTLPDIAQKAAPKTPPSVPSVANTVEKEVDDEQTLPDIAQKAAPKTPPSVPSVANTVEKGVDDEQTLPDIAQKAAPKTPPTVPSVANTVEKEVDDEQTLPDMAHKKVELPAGQVRALKSFRFILFGGLAALLLVVLLVGFFLISKLKGKGGDSPSTGNLNTPLVTENPETGKTVPQDANVLNVNTQAVAAKETSNIKNGAEYSGANIAEDNSPAVDNVISDDDAETTVVNATEAMVIRPAVAEVDENVEEGLKSLGEIVDGGVVLFGADSAAVVSLHSYLEANGGFAGVAYREASGDVREWCDQISVIQGGSPAFIVVIVSKEKNTSQFRRTLDELIKMLSAQSAAFLVNSGDAGVYEEVTHACTPVGMYVRKWASNKELADYLKELQQELGW